MSDYKEAASSFKRGLAIEPTNASLTSALANAEARVTEEDEEPSSISVPDASTGAPGGGPGGMDFGAMADMMRGMGGDDPAGGAGGGMGGMAGLLNNPMMMQMAQQMMGNGGLEVRFTTHCG